MFAVIQTGGKQYKVSVGSTLRVEKLDSEVGSSVILNHVLMLRSGDDVITDSHRLASVRVEGTLVDQIRTPKIIVFKKKRRQNYRRKKGHRQHMSIINIDNIVNA